MSASTSSLLKTCGFICSLSLICASSFATDLVLQKVPPITVAQVPAYPENLARYYHGAALEAPNGTAITDLRLSSKSDDTNTAVAALLCDDPTVGYALPAGNTTVLISFPKIENVDTISFLNHGTKGAVKIAIASAKLPADSPQWREVSEQKLAGSVLRAKIGPAEAKYVRLTFDVATHGRIAGFGIYSTPALSAFTMPRARNFTATEKSDTFGLIRYSLTDVHAKSRALYVSSGDDPVQANNMIDGQPASTYTFAAADSTPATIVDLGKVTTLRRISALYSPRHAAVDFYVLQSLPGSQAAPESLRLSESTVSNLTPVGSVLDEGAGRAAVDFPEMTGRYILVKWTPTVREDAAFTVAEISAFGKNTKSLIAANTSASSRTGIMSDGKTVSEGKDLGLGKDGKEIPAEGPPAEGPPTGLPQPPPFVFVPLVQPTSE
ncbi:MAG: hypothetical protein ABR514_12280 [Chthoniobacterales bacterium]